VGNGDGKRRILIGQSVPPTPIGMAFGRLKLWAQCRAMLRSNNRQCYILQVSDQNRNFKPKRITLKRIKEKLRAAKVHAKFSDQLHK
jgi:hypothetical protein